ncbi:MAG: hypothetical protein Q9174_005033, partial [Haloplaca sp. 1 TL-2023]
DVETEPRSVAGSARRLHDTLAAFEVCRIRDPIVEGESGGVGEQILDGLGHVGDGVGGGSGGGVEEGLGV